MKWLGALFEDRRCHFLAWILSSGFSTRFSENIGVFIAEHRGVLQGCAVIPYSGHSAYYLYGGSAARPVPGAMNLLHWEAMQHFSQLGTKRYDFVGTRIAPAKGSKQEGLKMLKSDSAEPCLEDICGSIQFGNGNTSSISWEFGGFAEAISSIENVGE
jgi:hypothetical protein